ncbi:MAG: hypothetical protein HGA96_07000 [Desulfobulbaceae bacterium]|nr:hypothetical protein [Desulfobulbaceae bacterium]
MQEISFKVQGSATEPYDLSFIRRSSSNLSAYCSCPAGENGQICKHRRNIFSGITEGIVSNNLEDVKTVQSWLCGTDVEVALAKVRKLEDEELAIKNALRAAKKELARTMRD